MTLISAKIDQITDPEERRKERLEHDRANQGVQLHDHQRRPDDGHLGTPVGFQIIPPTSEPSDLTFVVA